MPYKYDADGNLVTEEKQLGDRKVKLPIFITPEGKELVLDGDVQHTTINRLNTEASTHRRAKEDLEAKLTAFSGLDDPEAARKALETVSKLNQKQLIDAGEVDKVRAEVSAGFEKKLAEEKSARERLEATLFNNTIDTAFATSSLFHGETKKFGIPPDFVRARFGDRFGIENGQVYGVDDSGNKLYSRENPALLASFDEALLIMAESHPQRDSFFVGTGASGGGARGAAGGAAGGGGGKPGDLAGGVDDRRQALANKFSDLPRATAGA